MQKLLSLLGNGESLDLGKTRHYAAILGESPSRGAKSPVLWNKAFADLGISCEMHPMDVDVSSLEEVVENLRQDSRFIGGAVTLPHKVGILPYLDEIEPEARVIGAVNCLYRKDGKLVGCNTDGLGALRTLEAAYGSPLTGKRAMVIGLGGAGLAVATYVAIALGTSGELLLANRTVATAERVADGLSRYCAVEALSLPLPTGRLKDVDILVNCSSIGFEAFRVQGDEGYSLKLYSPLGAVPENMTVPAREGEAGYVAACAGVIGENTKQSLKLLASAPELFVFDIIYQPLQTVMLHQAHLLGLRTLNGVPMNLEQAVVAFVKAAASLDVSSVSESGVRESMRHVW